MYEYHQAAIPITLIALGFFLYFLEDSGDDDDQGGGLMQPAYQRSVN